MQLNRLVRFHKVMADPTRIRILVLLSKEVLHGQAIAGKLGLTPPTITHHLTKLREIGLVKEQRYKNTIYFILDKENLEKDAQATTALILEHQGEKTMEEKEDKFSVLKNFFTSDGKLRNLPVKRKKKIIVLEYMTQGLEMGKKYSEREINEHIQSYHEDYATIRREFIINQLMYRENGVYELNPSELWS